MLRLRLPLGQVAAVWGSSSEEPLPLPGGPGPCGSRSDGFLPPPPLAQDPRLRLPGAWEACPRFLIGEDERRGPFWLELCRRGSDARTWIPSPQLGGRNGTEGPALSPAPRVPPAQLQLHTCLSLSPTAPQGHRAPHRVLQTAAFLVSYGPGPGGPRSQIRVCRLGSGVAGLGPAGEDAPLPFRVPEASLARVLQRASLLLTVPVSDPVSSVVGPPGHAPKGRCKVARSHIGLAAFLSPGQVPRGGGGTWSGPRSQQGAHCVPLPPPSPTTPSPTSARQPTSSSLPWSSGPRGSRTSQSCPWTTRSSC